MKQKIKSFISLKVTSAMFGLLFFVALAGGMAINAPTVSATVTVNTQPVADFTSGTYKADAVFSVVNFGITQDATETLSSVAVTVVAEGVAVSGDFASLKVYKEYGTTVGFQLDEDTLVGTQATVNVGSATIISTGTETIGSSETIFYVVATLAVSPTDTNAFSVDMAVDEIVTSANSPTVMVLDGSATAIATIDTVAPTAAITYSDADGIVKSGDSLTITATFNEEMADSPTVQIALSGANTVTAVNMTKVDTTSYTYDHTVTTGDGTVTVALSTGTDVAANVITSVPTSGATFTVDNTAPVMISAVYKDIDEDGIVDRICATYSEDIEGSTFVESEWSFLPDPNSHNLVVVSGSISSTDVCITVTSDSETIDETEVKYTITAGTDGGITDGVNYAVNAELLIGAEEDEDEDEDDEDAELPDGAVKKQKQPNPNSGVTLYRLDGSPRVYVIKNKKRHWIQTPKEFNDAGYNWGKVKVVSAETLEEYPDDGETSTTELLRAVGSHKVYKINNGKRHWIETAGEFNAAGYKWKDIKDVSPEVLASYQNEVSSGLLRATGSHKVYIIENGKKRWIKTAGEFNAAGHRWGDVEDVSVATLDSYSDSETL